MNSVPQQRSAIDPTPAVEVSGVVKAFGRTYAVDGLDLTVPAGRVYGLLGPNGAGKTTAIRMLSTLTPPDAGVIRVFGLDAVRQADAVRGRIGLTGQFASVDEDLTGLENLRLLAWLHGFRRGEATDRAFELLDAFELGDAVTKSVRTYSGGMRRRLDIAATMLAIPDLLFLDEPTTGLDPRSRNRVWEIVRDLAASGTTVLLTTQYLDEADRLADRVAVMDRGRIVAEGTPAELKARVGAGSLRVRLAEPDARAAAVAALAAAGITALQDVDQAWLTARLPNGGDATAALDGLARAGVAVAEFSYGQPSLDEVFLSLTGGSASHDADREEQAA